MTAGRRETQRAARFKQPHQTPWIGGSQIQSTAASQIPDSKRFAVHKPGQVRPRAVENIRIEIQRALRARSSQLNIRLREIDFQIDAAAEFMNGRDVMVSTATGSGKTMCFQLPVITRMASIVLVICPLLSLMEDQVYSATRLGIKACAINYANQIQDPGLIAAVANGNYQLVFVSPEFCSPDNPQFAQLCSQTRFSERLCGIAIDEAHLCHSWLSFRPRYGYLHLLRHYFPDVGVMALSATMTPYVRRFIHNSVNMAPATRLIRRPIDRPNIYLAAIPLKHSTRSFKDLYFLLEPTFRHPVEIAQTIVFIDNRREACKACTKLWARVPAGWLEEHPLALADVSTALSDSHRTLVMQAFKLGICRILFATDVAGMGIDFPSVRRVIQWRVGPTLTISTLWQRFGRCVRDPTQQGVAMVLYSSSCVIPESGEPLSVLTQPARGEDAIPILRMIEDHSTGKPATTVRQHDPLDLEPGQDTDISPIEESQLDEPLADELNCSQLPQADEDDYFLDLELDLDELDFDELDLDELGVEEQELEEQGLDEQDPSSLDDNTRDSNDEDSDYEETENTKPSNAGSTQKRKFRTPASCRGVLWFLNTPQCRREVVLRIFEEPHFDSSKFDIPCASSPDSQLSTPCCDRHTTPDGLQSSLCRLLPTECHASPMPVDSDSDDSAWEDDGIEDGVNHSADPSAVHVHLNIAQKKTLRDEIKALRHTVWIRNGFAYPYSPYPAYKLLPDKHIEELLKQFSSMQDQESMCDILTTARLAIHPLWREPQWKEAFWDICEPYRAAGMEHQLCSGPLEPPSSTKDGEVTFAGETQVDVAAATSRSQRVRRDIRYYEEPQSHDEDEDSTQQTGLSEPIVLAVSPNASSPAATVSEPAKRKRGRPRKNDTTVSVPANDSRKRDPTPPDLGLPKRKRGRPSKKDIAEREVLKAAALQENDMIGPLGEKMNHDACPNNLGLPKRKRGRPSKKDLAEREEALKAAALLAGSEATVPEITE